MSSSRTATARREHDPQADKPSGLIGSWLRFWFTPVDPIGMHLVRILAGMIFLAWLLPFAGHLDGLFGALGWFDPQFHVDGARLQTAWPESEVSPPLQFGWSVLSWIGQGTIALTIVYWLSIFVVLLFTLGIFTRLTSVLTWVALASFTANPVLESDGDVLVRILSMYLMVGYVLLHQSEPAMPLSSRLVGSRHPMLLGRCDKRPCMWANMAMRLLQVHLAIVVMTSALHKLQFAEWWAGLALWYPVYSQANLSQIRRLAPNRNFYLVMCSLATYVVLAWQLGFPFFAWRRQWRALLVGGSVLAWLANATLYQVPIFGPAFLVGCLSFVSPAEWYRLLGILAKLPGLKNLNRHRAADHQRPLNKKLEKADAAALATTGWR